MIKVLIVEDKPPILWSIKQKVKSFSSSIKIIGEAFNGIEAIDIVKSNEPDIIITDIRMPIMDGLEMISELSKLNTSIKYIIISGHDEFEYARQAIKLNVKEYLLKPIDQIELNKVLQRLSSEIVKEKENIRQKIITDLINKKQYSQLSENYFCDYTNFYTMLICCGSYSHYTLNHSHPSNFIVSQNSLKEIAKKNIKPNIFFCPISISKLNEMTCVFCVPKNIDFNSQNTAEQFLQNLNTQDHNITIILSKEVSTFEEISYSVSNLNKLLKNNILFGSSNIINVDQTYSVHNNINIEIENQLIQAFKTKDREAFMRNLSDLIILAERLNYSQRVIENQLKRITGTLLDFSNNLQIDDYLFDVENIIMFNNSYRSLHKALISYFNIFFENRFKEINYKPIQETVDQIEHYIINNYSETITIQDISLMFNIDPCYLSKSFKQYKKVSPMNYLTQTRINVAKELMKKNPSTKLKEIAEIVGYSNQYYFSRIFKSVTNESPTTYKNNIELEISEKIQ